MGHNGHGCRRVYKRASASAKRNDSCSDNHMMGVLPAKFPPKLSATRWSFGFVSIGSAHLRNHRPRCQSHEAVRIFTAIAFSTFGEGATRQGPPQGAANRGPLLRTWCSCGGHRSGDADLAEQGASNVRVARLAKRTDYGTIPRRYLTMRALPPATSGHQTMGGDSYRFNLAPDGDLKDNGTSPSLELESSPPVEGKALGRGTVVVSSAVVHGWKERGHLMLKPTRRAIMRGATVALLLGVATLIPLGGGSAGASPVYSTMNDSGGVYWRWQPNWNDREVNPGSGFFPGTRVAVDCYMKGGSVPGSADVMWVLASWASGPGSGHGWINEHFVNDGAPINQAAAGVPSCESLVSCYGDYCSGTDPNSTGCGVSAVTMRYADFAGTGSDIELRWSPVCKTEWARTDFGGQSPQSLEAVQPATGYKEVGIVGTNGSWWWTRQIYSPSLCVYAAWVGPPGTIWTGCW